MSFWQQDQELYKLLFENASVGLVAAASDGRVLVVNRRFREILGYTEEDLQQLDLYNIIHPDEHKAAHGRIDALLAHEVNAYAIEKRFVHKRGHDVFVRCSVARVAAENGPVAWGLTIIEDITEQKRQEEALRQNAERYRLLARNIPHGAVFMFDKDLRYILAEGAGLEEAGYTREMVEGKLLHEVWPEEFIPSVEPLHKAALEGREITVEEGFAGYRYSVTYAPVRDDEGHIRSGMVMLSNITPEKHAQEALQHSEARFRTVWESAGDAMALSDPEGTVLAINHAYAELYGFTEAEVVGNTFAIIFPEEQRADAIKQYKALFQGVEDDALYESQVHRPDGECRWVESRAKFIVENGVRVAMLSVVRDITSRKRTEEALRASDERFRLIARATADLLWDYDLVANKLWWSQAYHERVGLPEGQELGGQLWRSILHPHDYERAVAKVDAVLRGADQYWTQEYRIRLADGSYICVLDRGYVMRDEQGRAVRMLGAMQDITQRKAQEQQIAEYAASQTQLLRQIMYAQEAERRRLSMEIHDGPLQSLGVSLLALDRAMRRREIGDDEHVELELRFLRQQISDTVQEVRGVLADLSHEVLDTYGLAVALQNHVDRFSDVTGIEVTLQNSLHKRLSGDKELLLYRLAQEAFANVRKHAGAEHIIASLGREGDQIKLTIQDDGRGFDVQEALHRHVDGQGVGLRSMQERIKAVGGRMEITSQPGYGTTVTFWCPAE